MESFPKVSSIEVAQLFLAHPGFDPGRANWVEALQENISDGSVPLFFIGLISRVKERFQGWESRVRVRFRIGLLGLELGLGLGERVA